VYIYIIKSILYSTLILWRGFDSRSFDTDLLIFLKDGVELLAKSDMDSGLKMPSVSDAERVTQVDARRD
jgi:hypothetical protein